jgi:metal-responsive CopG/Arc/MetJ family transcriptional regulator
MVGAAMKKVTYTLDEETLDTLERMAERLDRSKSQVVREAIKLYGEEVDRLSDEERDAMLRLFDEVTAAIPNRSRDEVKEELAEVTRARRHGGRRTEPEKDR